MKDYPWGKGTPVWTRDATLNDSDKSWTVPAGKMWDLKLITAMLVATATVGNRVVRIRYAPDGTNYINMLVGGSIAASNTGSYAVGFNQIYSPASSTAYTLMGGWPSTLLPAGAVVSVLDFSAIDAAADDLTVVLHYVEYDA